MHVTIVEGVRRMSEHHHMRYMKQHKERSCIFIFHMRPNTEEVLAVLLLGELVVFSQKGLSIQEASQVQVNRLFFGIIVSLDFALLKETRGVRIICHK